MLHEGHFSLISIDRYETVLIYVLKSDIINLMQTEGMEMQFEMMAIFILQLVWMQYFSARG